MLFDPDIRARRVRITEMVDFDFFSTTAEASTHNFCHLGKDDSSASFAIAVSH